MSSTNQKEDYIAPPWIKYPTCPKESSFWKSGTGAEYIIKYKQNVKNEDEYLKLFPKAPTFTEDVLPAESLSQDTKDYLNSSSKPLFIKLWEENAQPKFSVNLNNRKDIVFMFDSMLYDESVHIHIGTKSYSSANEILELVEAQLNEKSPNLWEELKYTVLLNVIYYKFVTDINFTKEIIKTNNNIIVFKSDNLDLGVQETEDGKYVGKNLLGLAVMELREVLKDVYEHYDEIDWEISGEPYSQERCLCGHSHGNI